MSNGSSQSEGRNSHHSYELIPAPATEPVNFGAGIQSAFGGHDSAGGAPDAARFLHALRRRWLMAVLVSLPLAAIAVCACWGFQPRLYTASALLRLAATESTIFERPDAVRSGQNTFEMYQRTHRQLLRSRYVIAPALRDKALSSVPVLRYELDPVFWLEENLNVSFPDESEIMQVSLSAGNPEGLHLLVNAVVKAYFDEIVNAERDRKLDRRNRLELANQRFENDLRAKRTEYQQLQERLGTGDSTVLTLQQQNLLQQYTSIKQSLAKTQLELAQAQGDLLYAGVLPGENAEESDHVTVGDHELLMALRSDKAAEQLRAERQRIVDLIAFTRDKVNEGVVESKLNQHKQRLETCERQIDARKRELRAELIEQKRLAAASGAESLNHRIEQLKSREKHLLTEAHDLDVECQKFNRSSIEPEMLRTDIATLQSLVSQLSIEIQRTSVELTTDTNKAWNRVTVLSDAQPARNTDAKSRLGKTIASGVAGFLLPAFLILWLDVRKHRINSSSEVVRGLGLSIIGAVPLIPPRIMRRIHDSSPREKFWRTLLSESVDTIAAVLLHGAKTENVRVVMVSSATAGEGKTTLAANLATSLAGAGCRTVLVDFDLRRPALHRVFDLPQQPGISDALRDAAQYDAALHETSHPRLAFLPAGQWTSSGLRSLGQADLKSLFERLRHDFEFVVVDGSPVLPIVDTRLIAQHVDSVVLSVLRDVSCIPQVRAACDLLASFAIPLMGVVMTGSRGDAYPNSTYEPYLSSDTA